MAENERKRLFELIIEYNVNNVVFISSDYHCSAASKITFNNGLNAYSVVAPPLHAPLRFANVSIKDVLKTESIKLENNNTVNVKTESWAGEGWLDFKVSIDTHSNTKVELSFNLKDFNDSSFSSIKWDLLTHQLIE